MTIRMLINKSDLINFDLFLDELEFMDPLLSMKHDNFILEIFPLTTLTRRSYFTFFQNFLSPPFVGDK